MPELRVAGAVALLGLLSAGLLAGCGQKGPLYLPEKARDIVTRPAGSTTTPPEEPQAPSTPRSPDSTPQPPNPAPEVTAPEDDEDKKPPGGNPPQS